MISGDLPGHVDRRAGVVGAQGQDDALALWLHDDPHSAAWLSSAQRAQQPEVGEAHEHAMCGLVGPLTSPLWTLPFPWLVVRVQLV